MGLFGKKKKKPKTPGEEEGTTATAGDTTPSVPSNVQQPSANANDAHTEPNSPITPVPTPSVGDTPSLPPPVPPPVPPPAVPSGGASHTAPPPPPPVRTAYEASSSRGMLAADSELEPHFEIDEPALRASLTDFYSVHEPAKLETLDRVIEYAKYHGVVKLDNGLFKKYGACIGQGDEDEHSVDNITNDSGSSSNVLAGGSNASSSGFGIVGMGASGKNVSNNRIKSQEINVIMYKDLESCLKSKRLDFLLDELHSSGIEEYVDLAKLDSVNCSEPVWGMLNFTDKKKLKNLVNDVKMIVGEDDLPPGTTEDQSEPNSAKSDSSKASLGSSAIALAAISKLKERNEKNASMKGMAMTTTSEPSSPVSHDNMKAVEHHNAVVAPPPVPPPIPPPVPPAFHSREPSMDSMTSDEESAPRSPASPVTIQSDDESIAASPPPSASAVVASPPPVPPVASAESAAPPLMRQTTFNSGDDLDVEQTNQQHHETGAPPEPSIEANAGDEDPHSDSAKPMRFGIGMPGIGVVNMADLKSRLRNDKQESEEGGSDGPCNNFRLNMNATAFNTCKCGYPKSAHAGGSAKGPGLTGAPAAGQVAVPPRPRRAPAAAQAAPPPVAHTPTKTETPPPVPAPVKDTPPPPVPAPVETPPPVPAQVEAPPPLPAETVPPPVPAPASIPPPVPKEVAPAPVVAPTPTKPADLKHNLAHRTPPVPGSSSRSIGSNGSDRNVKGVEQPIEKKPPTVVRTTSTEQTSPAPPLPPPAVPAPANSEPMDARSKVEAFYRAHNPDKLDTVDMIMERFKGREDVLLAKLQKKYQAEPF